MIETTIKGNKVLTLSNREFSNVSILALCTLESNGLFNEQDMKDILRLVTELKDRTRFTVEPLQLCILYNEASYRELADSKTEYAYGFQVNNYRKINLVPNYASSITYITNNIIDSFISDRHKNSKLINELLEALKYVILCELGLQKTHKVVGMGMFRVAISDGKVVTKIPYIKGDFNYIEHLALQYLGEKYAPKILSCNGEIKMEFIDGPSLKELFNSGDVVDIDTEILAYRYISIFEECIRRNIGITDYHFGNLIWDVNSKSVKVIDCTALRRSRKLLLEDFWDFIECHDAKGTLYDEFLDLVTTMAEERGLFNSLDENDSADNYDCVEVDELFEVYPELEELDMTSSKPNISTDPLL